MRHAMRAYLGSGGATPLILKLYTRWRWVVSFTPRPLYFWWRARYLLARILGRPQLL